MPRSGQKLTAIRLTRNELAVLQAVIIWPILAAIPALVIISLLVPDLCCRILMKRSIVERIRTE